MEEAGHRVTLVVEPGRTEGGGKDQPKFIGVPYGARARMILLYLQTQAIRTGSREVELGRSMRDGWAAWGCPGAVKPARRCGSRPPGSPPANCGSSWEGDTADGWMKGGFVRSGLRFHARDEDDGRQPSLWEDRVVLDEVFYEALRRHPVPLWEAALRELADRQRQLRHIYLARLPPAHPRQANSDPLGCIARAVRWRRLSELRNFKREFRKALAPAVVAYPEAHVEVDEAGLVLYPSRPPVAPRLVALAASSRGGS